MSGKVNEICELLRVEEIDIVCLSETHLTKNMTMKQLTNYHMIRQDRPTHLGGLITLIRKGIKFSETYKGQTALLEYIAITIQNEDEKIDLLNTYLPGGAERRHIINNLKDDLTILLNNNDNATFLMGDLNAKHSQWNNNKQNAAGKIIYDYSQSNDLSIYFPPDNTYCPMTDKKSPSTLDIIIANDIISCSNPFVKAILNSDHLPVFFRIYSKNSKSDTNISSKKNLHKANWAMYRKSLDSSLTKLTPLLTHQRLTENQIDETILEIITAVKSAEDISIPTETFKNGVFMTRELREAIRQRNYFRRRWIRHHRPEDNDNYKTVSKSIKRLTAMAINDKYNKIIDKCRPGDNTIYKIIKARNRRTMPPLYDNSFTTRLYDDKEKCMTLAGHFKNMHINSLEKNDMIFTTGIASTVTKRIDDMTPSNTPTLTSKEIHDIVKGLKTGKAAGDDQITVPLIRNFSYLGYELMTKIYNDCLKNGHYPLIWKTARTIPVHKSGKDPNDRTSYRPIAILPIFSKIFDKVINTKLTEFNEEFKIIPDNQFGFRRKHSTSHGLLYLFKKAQTNLVQKKSTGILTFDIEKAFDRVWHSGLLYKMTKHKYPDYLIKIIASFLKNRQFKVCIGQAESDIMQTDWGVPQGSAISPTLYNIFTSDIPTTFTDDTRLQIPVHIGLYADDTILFTSSRLCNDIEKRLQLASKTINRYFAKWKIKINNDKTTLTFLTKRKSKQLPTTNLNINNTDLPWTYELKYLGLTFDKKLTLRTHILKTLTKADTIIRLLYPYINRNSLINTKMKIHLFRTYIRPVLTYAAPILVQAAATNQKLLATKQNNVLRMALNISWESHTPNTQLEEMTKIPNLINFMNTISAKFYNNCTTSENQIVQSLLA